MFAPSGRSRPDAAAPPEIRVHEQPQLAAFAGGATLGPSRWTSTTVRRACRGPWCSDNSSSSRSRQAGRHGPEDHARSVHAGCIDCRISAAHGIPRPGFARFCPDRSGGRPFAAAIRWRHEFRALPEFGHHRPSCRSHAQCRRFQIVRPWISSRQNIVVSSLATIRLCETPLVPVSTGTRSLSSPEQVWMLLRARILIWVNRRAICPGCHWRANPTRSNNNAKP